MHAAGAQPRARPGDPGLALCRPWAPAAHCCAGGARSFGTALGPGLTPGKQPGSPHPLTPGARRSRRRCSTRTCCAEASARPRTGGACRPTWRARRLSRASPCSRCASSFGAADPVLCTARALACAQAAEDPVQEVPSWRLTLQQARAAARARIAFPVTAFVQMGVHGMCSGSRTGCQGCGAGGCSAVPQPAAGAYWRGSTTGCIWVSLSLSTACLACTPQQGLCAARPCQGAWGCCSGPVICDGPCHDAPSALSGLGCGPQQPGPAHVRKQVHAWLRSHLQERGWWGCGTTSSLGWSVDAACIALCTCQGCSPGDACVHRPATGWLLWLLLWTSWQGWSTTSAPPSLRSRRPPSSPCALVEDL